jgi:predicted ATPase
VAVKGSIPQETTSFVGRRPELVRVGDELARHRLITLTGPGGVGKTRLAQRAAAYAVDRSAAAAYGGGPGYEDGAWWADLSTLDDPHLLLATVSDAVDLADHSPRTPVEVLCEWLAGKRLLLVLDSCEHVVEECAYLVGELLTAAPGLTVLATSRRALGCRGEALVEVAPLPPDGPDALALFDARVAARSGRGPLDAPGAAGAAESICRRLEGIPLAIELAAAQVGPATVAEVAARLGARFDARPEGASSGPELTGEELPGAPSGGELTGEELPGEAGPGGWGPGGLGPREAGSGEAAPGGVGPRGVPPHGAGPDGVPPCGPQPRDVPPRDPHPHDVPPPDASPVGTPSRLDLLSRDDFVWPRRHRALRTAIGWSHELCAPLERLLWARLSVFRGTFDLAAAQAVTAGGPLAADQVAPTLDRLVAQSVVRRTRAADGTDQHLMLDTIREYGHSWLRELDEVTGTAQRHAEHFSGLAAWADAAWSTSDQLLAYRRIEDAHPDLRAALDHWLRHDPARAAELGGLLVYFWTCCGHLKEARDYLERALALHTAPDPARLRALTGLGATVTLQGDYPRAAEISAQVRAAAEAGGDRDERIGAACLAGLLGMMTGQAQQAVDVVREAVGAAAGSAPAAAFGSPDRLRCALVEVLALTVLGSFEEGRARALELREHCVRTGELWTRSYLDYQLSIVALFSGEPADAAGYARTMLESKRLLGDAFGIALGLDVLAAALAAEGRAEQAASVYGTGAAYWRSVGHPQRGAPELEPVRARCEQTARAALGDTAYTSAFARGATANPQSALSTALHPNPT